MRVSGDGQGYLALFGGGDALADGEVSPYKRVRMQQGHEQGVHIARLGYDLQPARAAVQPVHGVEAFSLAEMALHKLAEGGAARERRGMHLYPRGLVDDDEVVVLKYHGDIDIIINTIG